MSGNMIAITDDTGAIAAKFSYTPFGEVTESVIGRPACDIPVGFAGLFGVLREPNGLYYMNARYYDPTIGRFISEDPAGLGGGDLTLYSYAGNNPVVFVDPSGLCSQSGGMQSWYMQSGYTPEQQGLQDIVNDISNGGRTPIRPEDAGAIIDLGKGANYPGIRAGPSDVQGDHWIGPHIHVPHTGRGGHVPVQPGVEPITPEQASQMAKIGTIGTIGIILIRLAPLLLF
jgi:RHS repeat-associated protein